MEDELIDALTAKGFAKEAMGGNIEAMVRQRDGKTEVITAHDGGLPDASDWLFCVYEGDWLSDPDAKEIDNLGSEMSPMHILEVVDL